MLCVSICPKDVQELLEDFALAKKVADIVEVRVDAFAEVPFDTIKKISSFPVILSMGKCKKVSLLQQLESLQPAYLDVPHDVALPQNSSFTKRICSYHDYHGMPDDLDALVQKLKSFNADIIKIVPFANSALDGLKALSFLKDSNESMACFCMGTKGSFTRVLAPIYGSKICYTCLPNKPTAEGQISCDELLKIYNYAKITSSTRPFALIGNPITTSQSHITHNVLFSKLGMDAVYVKVPLDADEVQKAFGYFTELGFGGLSVTIPLKKCFSEEANNTVKWQDKTFALLNTDGKAMLDALEQFGQISHKTIALLGAGGTAEGIAKEALMRGANVIIINRNEERGKKLAESLGCQSHPWDAANFLSFPYDILINATTVGMNDDALPLQKIAKDVLVGDVCLKPDTHLVGLAMACGARAVTGREMWVRQAAYQFCFWNKELEYDRVLTLLRGAL